MVFENTGTEPFVTLRYYGPEVWAEKQYPNVGDHKNFDVQYPADYPDAKLAAKKFHYEVDVTGIKTKKLPELNDEFAKELGQIGDYLSAQR